MLHELLECQPALQLRARPYVARVTESLPISLLLAAIAGLGYSLGAFVSKRALHEGMGVLRLAFISNWLFVLVFILPLIGSGLHISSKAQLYQPVITGIFFFLGQVFTFTAIRLGDVSLQTPVMGTKAVFVVLIAILAGTEVITAEIGMAAVVSALAVALLGFSGVKGGRTALTISMALLSSLFFAVSDTLVGVYGREFGTESFLFLAMMTNALLSMGLIFFFRAPLTRSTRPQFLWTLAAGLFMAAQALLINWTLSEFGNVSSINILYSTRGLWSVVLAVPLALSLAIPTPQLTRRLLIQRLIGAALMSVSIVLVITS